MMDDQEKYRFFCDALPPGSVVELFPAEAHHAMHVLRLSAGAVVELFDGRGRRAEARIVQARHGKVSVEVVAAVQSRPRPAPAMHLAFAVPKGKRLDWLLEKATELGAASLRPVIFERGVSGGAELSESKRDRWLTHCVAAAKQCGLDFLPEICEPMKLSELVADSTAAIGQGQGSACRSNDDLHALQIAIFGDLSDSAASLPQALANWRVDQPVLVLVGPEGGLTVGELAALKAAGFVGVRLGDTTLRIETAALALLAGVIAQR
jgi:16S rRNA (uracil1498-N3)-methyltransferase